MIQFKQEDLDQFGKNYEDYLAKFEQEGQRRRWKKSYEKVEFTEEQMELLKMESRNIKIVSFSASWCGDCVMGVPILARMAEEAEYLDLYLIDRDDSPELFDQFLVNGEKRIPMVLFLSEDNFEVERWFERSTAAYKIYTQVKQKTKDQPKEEFTKAIRSAFNDAYDTLQVSTVSELFDNLARTVAVTNASSRLAKIDEEKSA